MSVVSCVGRARGGGLLPLAVWVGGLFLHSIRCFVKLSATIRCGGAFAEGRRAAVCPPSLRKKIANCVVFVSAVREVAVLAWAARGSHRTIPSPANSNLVGVDSAVPAHRASCFPQASVPQDSYYPIQCSLYNPPCAIFSRLSPVYFDDRACLLDWVDWPIGDRGGSRGARRSVSEGGSHVYRGRARGARGGDIRRFHSRQQQVGRVTMPCTQNTFGRKLHAHATAPPPSVVLPTAGGGSRACGSFVPCCRERWSPVRGPLMSWLGGGGTGRRGGEEKRPLLSVD